MNLGQLDEAKECFELLKSLGQRSTADDYLEKVEDAMIEQLTVAELIEYSAKKIEAKVASLIKQHETQAQKTKNEAQKTVRYSLSAYLIIAIGTLFISIYLNWQFKNQIRY